MDNLSCFLRNFVKERLYKRKNYTPSLQACLDLAAQSTFPSTHHLSPTKVASFSLSTLRKQSILHNSLSSCTFVNRFVSFLPSKHGSLNMFWMFGLTHLLRCQSVQLDNLFRMGLSPEWTGGGRVRLTEHMWLKHSRIKQKEMMWYRYGVGFWFLPSCPSSSFPFKG